MFLRIHVFLGPGPGFTSSPKVDCCFKLFTFTSWFLCLQIFFFFKYQRKKIYTPNLIVALKFSFISWLFSERLFYRFHTKDFLLQNNLSATQTMLIFYIQRKMCVNFLKYLINFLKANFIFINVGIKQS